MVYPEKARRDHICKLQKLLLAQNNDSTTSKTVWLLSYVAVAKCRQDVRGLGEPYIRLSTGTPKVHMRWSILSASIEQIMEERAVL